MRDRSLIFLDLETTGTRTTRDRITEIAAPPRFDMDTCKFLQRFLASHTPPAIRPLTDEASPAER